MHLLTRCLPHFAEEHLQTDYSVNKCLFYLQSIINANNTTINNNTFMMYIRLFSLLLINIPPVKYLPKPLIFQPKPTDKILQENTCNKCID